MADIFKQCFDTISHDSTKNVEIYMADVLIALIEESSSLTTEVVDTLLAQFLPKNVVRCLSRVDHR